MFGLDPGLGHTKTKSGSQCLPESSYLQTEKIEKWSLKNLIELNSLLLTAKIVPSSKKTLVSRKMVLKKKFAIAD